MREDVQDVRSGGHDGRSAGKRRPHSSVHSLMHCVAAVVQTTVFQKLSSGSERGSCCPAEAHGSIRNLADPSRSAMASKLSSPASKPRKLDLLLPQHSSTTPSLGLTLYHADLVLGASQRQSAVSRAMSSSQCLRRLALQQPRPASLFRNTPTASRSLLRRSQGVRTLATGYTHSSKALMGVSQR